MCSGLGLLDEGQLDIDSICEIYSCVVGVHLSAENIDSSQSQMIFSEFLEFILNIARAKHSEYSPHGALQQWLRNVKAFKKFLPSTVVERSRDNPQELWPWVGFRVGLQSNPNTRLNTAQSSSRNLSRSVLHQYSSPCLPFVRQLYDSVSICVLNPYV